MPGRDDWDSILSLLDEIEDRLDRLTPERYRSALKHFIRARVEVLKGIEELIRVRREELERRLEEDRGPKREKVEVE